MRAGCKKACITLVNKGIISYLTLAKGFYGRKNWTVKFKVLYFVNGQICMLVCLVLHAFYRTVLLLNIS